MTLIQEDERTSRIVIESFYREGPDARSVQMDTVKDTNALMAALRRDHGICGSPEAVPVIIMTDPNGDVPGNDLGTVTVCGYDEHRLQTIGRAIRCLQAVRDGLIEAGHTDGPEPASVRAVASRLPTTPTVA